MNNSLKAKLRRSEFTLGSWISIGHPAVAEILARVGFDWLVIDLEHSVIGIETAGELIRVIDLCGVTPLVRLTSNSPDQIKRVMDAGAAGIVVPMVNCAEEAVRAVAATRYAPQGRRGVGLSRAQGYGVAFAEYLEWQREGPVVIVQIEHQDAIPELESILQVPGVDGFIIGPYDLSCSMGIPGRFDDRRFQDALARIRETGKRLGCPAGMHIVEPDLVRLAETRSEGYTFVAYSVDFRMLDVVARHGFAAAVEAAR